MFLLVEEDMESGVLSSFMRSISVSGTTSVFDVHATNSMQSARICGESWTIDAGSTCYLLVVRSVYFLVLLSQL